MKPSFLYSITDFNKVVIPVKMSLFLLVYAYNFHCQPNIHHGFNSLKMFYVVFTVIIHPKEECNVALWNKYTAYWF